MTALVPAPVGRSDGAFVDLYDRTVVDVYSYVMSRIRLRATAEDLTQEVFLAGARRHAAGGAVDVAWLIAVARNKVVDHWRSAERHDARLRAVVVEQSRQATDPAEPATGGRVEDALERVNPRYRAALVLRHVDGLSVPEVAAHLECSVAAAEQVLVRARAAFRTAYEEQGDE